MTRDEIYDHLAQVYLGKKNRTNEKKKWPFNAWLFMNMTVTVIILTSAFYGFTAFLTSRREVSRNNIIFTLHNGPIRITYNLNEPYPPVKTFTLSIPDLDVEKYHYLRFSIRGLEEGSPGIVKVVLSNRKKETSSYFILKVHGKWQEYKIPFENFNQITDWTSLTDVSFILEGWNVEKKQGIILIDSVCFSS